MSRSLSWEGHSLVHERLLSKPCQDRWTMLSRDLAQRSRRTGERKQTFLFCCLKEAKWWLWGTIGKELWMFRDYYYCLRYLPHKKKRFCSMSRVHDSPQNILAHKTGKRYEKTNMYISTVLSQHFKDFCDNVRTFGTDIVPMYGYNIGRELKVMWPGRQFPYEFFFIVSTFYSLH